MFSPILGPRTGNRYHGSVQINLRPAQSANLVTTRAKQNQEFNDCAVLVVTSGAPDSR
jgi:hypothetical protein